MGEWINGLAEAVAQTIRSSEESGPTGFRQPTVEEAATIILLLHWESSGQRLLCQAITEKPELMLKRPVDAHTSPRLAGMDRWWTGRLMEDLHPESPARLLLYNLWLEVVQLARQQLEALAPAWANIDRGPETQWRGRVVMAPENPSEPR